MVAKTISHRMENKTSRKKREKINQVKIKIRKKKVKIQILKEKKIQNKISNQGPVKTRDQKIKRNPEITNQAREPKSLMIVNLVIVIQKIVNQKKNLVKNSRKKIRRIKNQKMKKIKIPVQLKTLQAAIQESQLQGQEKTLELIQIN